MNQLVTTNTGGGIVRHDPNMVSETAGEKFAESISETVEAEMTTALHDMNVRKHRRMLGAAQRRLETINGDFAATIARLKGAWSPAQEGMVKLYVEGSREELLACYQSVQNGPTSTPEARKRIEQLVDTVIAGALKEVEAARPAVQDEPGNAQPRKPDGRFAEPIRPLKGK